ncbi:MAG: Bax inhibitor-1 family protein [Puniceicoccales bacterium]|jgi:FtsH-binding integral membrane protein|nr:Bax inhibitor-1 family protein [Puniceicoccales bacterium]
MQYYDNPFAVADAPAPARAAFYRKTYAYAAGTFGVWAAMLATLFLTGAANPIIELMFNETAGRYSWLLVLGLFWVATYFGQKLAFSRETGSQYLGLGVYAAAYAVLFVPLIAGVAVATKGDIMSVLAPAGISTAALFGALTATVFMTSKDFSFLRTFVVFGSFVALGAIVVFTIFGINPGALFSVAMIVLMSAAVLWQTWQIKDQFDTTQHVGAAAVIFASFMTLLWYVIQLFMSRR